MPVRMNNSDEWRKYLAAIFVVVLDCINFVVRYVLVWYLKQIYPKVNKYLCFY